MHMLALVAQRRYTEPRICPSDVARKPCIPDVTFINTDDKQCKVLTHFTPASLLLVTMINHILVPYHNGFYIFTLDQYSNKTCIR